MISRQLKQTYYFLSRYPMALNGWRHRHLNKPKGIVKVHLGPGQSNYLKGWINVDANIVSAKADIWADIRNPLPFPDASVDIFYSHHVIEHLPDALLQFHFLELSRCLKKGGVIRVGGPNGDMAARKLTEGDVEWFGVYPDERESLGGRFANFILCRGEHLTILTTSYLTEVAFKAGFTNIRTCRPAVETFHPDLVGKEVLEKEYESTPDAPHTLLIEAEKK